MWLKTAQPLSKGYTMSILTSRRHTIMKARGEQLRLNELSVYGGRPYISARLWRAPNETDTSWDGDPQRGIVGRKERTALVSDAARVANKINQYIFKTPAGRDGADDAFLKNCTGDGEGVHDFMQRVCLSITFGGWCWLQVDRAPLAEGESETEADKKPLKWILWNAADISDWRIGEDGEIKWLIAMSNVYQNDDPRAEAKEGTLYTLYEKKEDGVYITEETDSKVGMADLRTNYKIPGLKKIPFVLIGKPSARAWWFDDVENLQAQVLNLDSQHNETLTENVFPQMIVPTSLANSLEVKLSEQNIDGKKVVALIRELTLGRKIPIQESSEDKGISRYIMPTGDLKLLTDECTRKRALLFDMAGLALFNKESRQIQTAESKAFDQLDTNSTLGNRALLLQAAEAKLLELSQMFDKNFKVWEPKYPADFDVVDVAALAQALTQVANAPDKTPKMRRLIAKAVVRILKELAASIATDEEFDEALKEIDEHDFAEPTMLPNPFGDEDEDEEEEEE